MYYEVAYGSNRDREFEGFKSKKKAEKFAKEKVKEGKEKVFLDTYDNDLLENLIDYKSYN